MSSQWKLNTLDMNTEEGGYHSGLWRHQCDLGTWFWMQQQQQQQQTNGVERYGWGWLFTNPLWMLWGRQAWHKGEELRGILQKARRKSTDVLRKVERQRAEIHRCLGYRQRSINTTNDGTSNTHLPIVPSTRWLVFEDACQPHLKPFEWTCR